MKDKFSEKYPDSYWDHYIAMFNDVPTKEAFEEHAGIGLHFEGKEYLETLVKEYEVFVENNDLDLLKSFVSDHFGMKELVPHLEEMYKVTKKVLTMS